MPYKIPQNIDIEDKIVGPLTFKQLVTLGIGGGICYLSYAKLDPYTWPVIVFVVGGLTLAITFLKIQQMPFGLYLASFLSYIIKPEKRIWQKGADRIQLPKDYLEKRLAKQTAGQKGEQEALSADEKVKKNLRQLSQILDTHGNGATPANETTVPSPQDMIADDDLLAYSFLGRQVNLNNIKQQRDPIYLKDLRNKIAIKEQKAANPVPSPAATKAVAQKAVDTVGVNQVKKVVEESKSADRPKTSQPLPKDTIKIPSPTANPKGQEMKPGQAIKLNQT